MTYFNFDEDLYDLGQEKIEGVLDVEANGYGDKKLMADGDLNMCSFNMWTGGLVWGIKSHTLENTSERIDKGKVSVIDNLDRNDIQEQNRFLLSSKNLMDKLPSQDLKVGGISKNIPQNSQKGTPEFINHDSKEVPPLQVKISGNNSIIDKHKNSVLYRNVGSKSTNHVKNGKKILRSSFSGEFYHKGFKHNRGSGMNAMNEKELMGNKTNEIFCDISHLSEKKQDKVYRMKFKQYNPKTPSPLHKTDIYFESSDESDDVSCDTDNLGELELFSYNPFSDDADQDGINHGSFANKNIFSSIYSLNSIFLCEKIESKKSVNDDIRFQNYDGEYYGEQNSDRYKKDYDIFDKKYERCNNEDDTSEPSNYLNREKEEVNKGPKLFSENVINLPSISQENCDNKNSAISSDINTDCFHLDIKSDFHSNNLYKSNRNHEGFLNVSQLSQDSLFSNSLSPFCMSFGLFDLNYFQEK